MTWTGVPPQARARLARPWIPLAVLLALAAGLVLARPVTSWRPLADEGFYLRCANRIVTEGVGAFPAVFHEFLTIPDASRLFPSPARLTPILYDALAVRLAGPRFEVLAYGSLLAFLALIVVVFVAARPIFGDPGALLSALLVATSPLGLGMARRALSDSLNALLLTSSLALVIHGVASRRGGRWWAGTSLAFATALLGKELNLVLVPLALTVVAIDAIRRRRRPSPGAIACVSVVPVVLAFGAITLAAGGASTAWRALVAVVTQPGVNEYALQFGGGPWYRYLLDHLLLSPWSTLLYLLWTGYALGTHLDDEELLSWTLVPPLFLLCVAPFVKFVRWALFLDVPLRLGTAALLLAYAGGPRTRALVGILAVGVVATQLAAFYQLFIVADLYDPTSVDLLGLQAFLPLP